MKFWKKVSISGKLIAMILLCALLVLSCGGKSSEEAAEETVSPDQVAKALPRNETLYVNGMYWGPPSNFNPLNTNPAFPINTGNFIMEVVYETVFMYNQLTNEAEPLLGESYSWRDDMTLEIKLNKAAEWSDGEALTAEDVAYSYKLGEKYPTPWASLSDYIEDAVSEDEQTVLLKLNPDNPNPLFVVHSTTIVPIVPKHVWEKIEVESGNDFAKISQEFNPDPVASGPYRIMYYDDTRIVAVRNDNYWGKALFGKLPAPKYIAHIIYKSNDAGTNAFRQHEVDISQQFINQAWKLWEDGEPYKTYFDDVPYHLPATIPQLIFNMTKPVLGDNVDVRRAVAMAIDYEKIAEVAMSNYSIPAKPGFLLQTEAELSLIDRNKIESVSYSQSVDDANALLDSIGAERGDDGVRVLPDGTRLGPWDVSCPYGWTDWNAALEIVVQSVRKIGIELRTNFPEFPVWYNDAQVGNFDICMWLSTGASVAQPWDRARGMLDSSGVPPVGEPVASNNNFGRYKNERVDELIKMIPTVKDTDKLRELYTELDTIFIEDVSHVPLMYRPGSFYTVYEGVWKGFPDSKNNPENIPPSTFSGAFIKSLYNIQPVE